MKEGGMENLDEHITKGIERDNAETGSREKIDPPEPGNGYINKDEAWVTAHAEKPFRDAARNKEYLEKASEDTKEFLDWVASKEGEKALELFRAQSGAEKDRVREILIKKAIDGINIRNVPWSIARRERGDREDRKFKPFLDGEEDKGRVLKAAVEVGRIVARPEIEKVLDGQDRDKPARVADIAEVFVDVLENTTPIQNIVNKFSKSRLDIGVIREYAYEADFAWRLAEGFSPVGGLRRLARGTHSYGAYDEEVEKETRTLLRKYLPLITSVRNGEVAGDVPERFKEERDRDIDGDLEKQGFIFDEESRKYIEAK